MKQRLGWIITLLIGIAILAIGWVNRYNIYDYIRLYNYNPPAEVAQLADQTTMTAYGKKLFYVYHPTIENAAAFNKNCTITREAIVLGCTQINGGIWIYDVTNPQLNGIEQVTAAHEMLHVGYSRLSGSELKYINSLIWSTYTKLAPTDPMLKSEYNTYLKTEGQGAVLNELHSVLGTEISTSELPAALNDYYAQYFTNRQVIVNYANQYEGVFMQKQNQITQDSKELSAQYIVINSNQATILADEAKLKQQLAQLNSEKSDPNKYNAGVGPYNAAVSNLNNLAKQNNVLIDSYNKLQLSMNALTSQLDELNQSASSLPLSTVN
jgi:hypothetical protein